MRQPQLNRPCPSLPANFPVRGLAVPVLAAGGCAVHHECVQYDLSRAWSYLNLVWRRPYLTPITTAGKSGFFQETPDFPVDLLPAEDLRYKLIPL